MITNQCGHTHVHVYLFETTCEDYSINSLSLTSNMVEALAWLGTQESEEQRES